MTTLVDLENAASWGTIFDRSESLARSVREQLDRNSFEFHHGLHLDARMQLSEIGALARRLRLKYYDVGEIPVSGGWDAQGTSACTFEDAVSNLENSNTWIILKKVQEDPQYSALLGHCLHEAEKLSGRDLGAQIESSTMSLIVTSPGRITPFHMDMDCNFLFQIMGTKTVYIFDKDDSEVVRPDELERFFNGEDRAVPYRDGAQSHAKAYELMPGSGVHVPVAFPHWVRNGGGVSISLSINFRFVRSRYNAYRANVYLRKAGLKPAAIGATPGKDRLKARLFQAAKSFTGILRKDEDVPRH